MNEIVKKAALDVSVIWAKAIGDRLTIPLYSMIKKLLKIN